MNGLKKKRTVRKVATGEKGKIKKAESKNRKGKYIYNLLLF